MKKTQLLLVGAGQHAGVVIYNAMAQGVYDLLGIVDRQPELLGQHRHGLPVIAQYSEDHLRSLRVQYPHAKFHLAFGHPLARQLAFDAFCKAGFVPASIIHPHALIAPEASIGAGSLIECGCLITSNPCIGQNVLINTGVQVNHDNQIHDHVHLASGVILAGDVTIEEATLVGTGAIVSRGCRIGARSIIGAGAVVTKDLPADIVAFGNPCRVVRERTEA